MPLLSHTQALNNKVSLIAILLLLLAVAACTATPSNGESIRSVVSDSKSDNNYALETLPAVKPVRLDAGQRLRVVASTNLVADVVAAVGGDAIELTGLMSAGADPHGFIPTAQDLIELNSAHVIFINGLGLEESLTPVLDVPNVENAVVSVNSGVQLLKMGHSYPVHTCEEHTQEGRHEGADPHTWFSIQAVAQWVQNIEVVLSDLDPQNAKTYATNAQSYLAELEMLEAEVKATVAQLAPTQRKLVTDHHSLTYLANEYGFEVVGTVIPTLSTMAAPSALQLSQLHDQMETEGVGVIFVGTTVNASVAEAISADTGAEIVTIYTGSLSLPGGPADSYLDFMRYNIEVIVEALQ